jgi:SAM-dependent methyltransferase
MRPDTTDPRLEGLPPLGARQLVVAGPGWPVALEGASLATPCAPEALGDQAAGVWDAVGLLGVLAHVEAPTDLLDEAVGRLAPGGVLILAEVTVGGPEALRTEAGGWPPFRRWQLGSVLQGYGLQDLGFSPLTLPDGTDVMRVWGRAG